MMDCISQALCDHVTAESALEHLHSIIILYLVQQTKGYVCWFLQYAAGSGIFPFFKQNVSQILATHTKKDLVRVCMWTNQPLVVKTDRCPVGRGGQNVFIFIIIPKYLSVDCLQHKALLWQLKFHRRVQEIHSHYVTLGIVL